MERDIVAIPYKSGKYSYGNFYDIIYFVFYACRNPL